MKGSIRRRGKNSWELTVDLGRDAKGRRLRKFVNVNGRKSTAEKRLRELLSATDRGLPPDTSKETVSEFVARWLRDVVATTTKPRTQQFYEMISRLYIEPVVGHVPLQRLSPGDVQKVISGVYDKGLSGTTARRVYATLHRALECGLKWGAVHRNVCDAIDPPKEEDYEASPPNRSALKALLEIAQETPYGAAIWLLAYTGARRGEVCGIKREALDLKSGTLSIAGAVVRQGHVPSSGVRVRHPVDIV